MQNKTKQKLNFFQRFFASFASPEFYIRAIAEPVGKAVRYSLILTAFMSLLAFLFWFPEIRQVYQNMDAFIQNENFPDIEISGGELQLTKQNNIELKINDRINFIAVLDGDDSKDYTILNNYSHGVYLNRKFLAFRHENSSPYVLKFETAGDITLAKDSLLPFLQFSKILSYLILLLFYFAQLSIQYFIKAFIILFIISRLTPYVWIKELNLKGAQVYSIILYAMSIATLIIEFYYFFGFTNQLILAILIFIFYMLTTKIVKSGVATIVLDKTGIDPSTDFFNPFDDDDDF